MTIGPGTYDEEATLIREATNAHGIILIVLGGNRGSGFSCQLTTDNTLFLPKMLRELARQIESDIRKNIFIQGELE